MKVITRIVIGAVSVIVLVIGSYFIYCHFSKKEEISLPGISTGITLTTPLEILENKFGFLSGGPEDADLIKKYGALWARPHPGPFLWDSMQKSETSLISFTNTDRIIEDYQEQKIGILATLWPFADWDQKERADASKCRVSSQDEFLPRNDKKGRLDYLPQYRCNPHDWEAYQGWIKAVVERYDGDGTDDMPDLKIPIKYWEVMNEPDLDGGERLDFYNEEASAYAELLIKTSEVIRAADSEAEILIAGAAGGNNRFLNFYREVFRNKDTFGAFDIANVHCISNDDFQSFNVKPYQEMLKEFGITKPIWVTEAEAIISKDPDVNASQTLASTRGALRLGADRIFFTRYEFEYRAFGEGDKLPLPRVRPEDLRIELQGVDPEKAYKAITSQ